MGDEPVKNDAGCQGGTMVGTDHKDEIVRLTFRSDMREGDELVEVVRESTIGGDGQYDTVKVKRSWTSWIFYGEDAQSYQNAEWKAADKTDVKYEQCPHCKAFDAEHERWRYWMHGARWGTRFDQQTGYATYREMMDKFHNDKDLWQEAYIADFRARREYIKAEKEWDQRNRIPFYDGIIVDSDGYALRARKNGPSPAKLRRHEREVAKVKKQIDKYVNDFIAELTTGNMPMPGGGDCWYCLMRTNVNERNEHVESGQGMTWGDMGDNDHLFSHIEEKYYVPSLAVNALRERGYQDTGIYMILDMDPVRPDREGSGKMIGTGKMGKAGGRYDNVKRDLVAYMRKRMVPQAPTE